MEPLPVAVERRLVVLRPEYRRGYIDGSIIVYSPRHARGDRRRLALQTVTDICG